MSWREISVKFANACSVCGKTVEVGTKAMWASGQGIRHTGCGESSGIRCAVCGAAAGCSECELADDCDLERVSQLCLCSKHTGKRALEAYRAAALERFPSLGAERPKNATLF